MTDIYKYFDLFFINTSDSNNLYIKKNNKYQYINRNNIMLKDFIKINKMKPIYNLPTRIVYEIWLSDSCHNINHFKKL